MIKNKEVLINTQIFYIFILLFSSLLLLQSCQKENKPPKENLMAVQLENHTSTLFFNGIIQPLMTRAVINPASGVVVETHFQYGEWVEKGHLLFKIASTKFVTDYKLALVQYIKAKGEFENSQTQLKEADFLYQHQLISRDEFKNKQSTFYSNQLALFEAKELLDIFIKKLNIQEKNLNTLNIANIKEIAKLIHVEKNTEYLNIFSPLSGVVLSAGKEEEEKKKILTGETVKEDEVLALIGDMNGLTVKIKVNELTVNQLHINQPVKLTGLAFSDELTGKITRIDHQGESTSFGQPTFTVVAVVPKLTSAQKLKIHAGMSAKVEINIMEKPSIMIPFSALIEKNNEYFVLVYDKAKPSPKKILKKITIKQTTPDKIIVLAGLKQGEYIVDIH